MAPADRVRIVRMVHQCWSGSSVLHQRAFYHRCTPCCFTVGVSHEDKQPGPLGGPEQIPTHDAGIRLMIDDDSISGWVRYPEMPETLWDY